MVKTCKKTWFPVSGEDFPENPWMLNVSCGWTDQNWRLNEDEWSWIDLGSFIERCIDQNRFAPTSIRCEAQQKTLRSNLFTPSTQLYQDMFFFPGGCIPVRVLCILPQKCHKDFGHMIAKSLRAPTGGSSWKLKLLTST
jgi:hypothetical protein